MMGGMTDELKEKIEEMESVNTANRKMVDTASLKQQRQKLREESYI